MQKLMKSIEINSQTGLELGRSQDNSRNINMVWEGYYTGLAEDCEHSHEPLGSTECEEFHD